MSQLQAKLQEAQDDQRSKLLDLREQALNEREQLLNSETLLAEVEALEANIAILTTQVKQREAQKASLNTTLHNLENQVGEARKKFTQAAETTERDIQRLDSQKLAKEQQLRTVEDTLSNRKNEVRNILNDIKNHKKYRDEQENIVNDTIAEWNVQLNQLKQEADNLEAGKRKLSAEVLAIEQLKSTKQDELDALNNKLSELQKVYDSKLAAMKAEIKGYKEQIAIKQTELTDVDQTVNTRLQALATREKALLVKEGAVRKLEADLKSREQKLNMQLNMLEM